MQPSEKEEAEHVDITMGPCVGCGDPGEDAYVHHTACECGLETCVIVICDGCRMAGGIWASFGEDDNAVEVHIDCYIRMEKRNALIADAAEAEELFPQEELEEAAAQWRKDHE